MIPVPVEPMGSTSRLTVGLQHENVASSSGAECGTAETADAAADHNNINIVLHPVTPDRVIIVVAATQEWPPVG